jgi:plastocyanin
MRVRRMGTAGGYDSGDPGLKQTLPPAENVRMKVPSLILHGFVVAGALAVAPPAAAGVIKGVVELGAAPAAATRAARPNPYPGRANSIAGAGTEQPGGVGETIVYVEKLPAGAAALPPPAERPELEQRRQAFAPRVLAVQAGTVVEFPNRDPVYHNVFSVSPAKRFDLGKYPKGQSRRLKFDKPGLVNVFCDIHSDMAAYVFVLPHHVFARPAAATGRFALPDVPAGTYVVKAWHPDRGELTQSVQVPKGGDAAVTLRY